MKSFHSFLDCHDGLELSVSQGVPYSKSAAHLGEEGWSLAT